MDPEALHILFPQTKGGGEKSKSFHQKKSKIWLWVIIAWVILVGIIAFFTYQNSQVLG